MQKCAFALLEHACDVVRCLSYLYRSLGTGVRPLNEDELLYTRLGKRGKCVLSTGEEICTYSLK